MLKVSSFFILLCGLLASSSAQEVLSRVSSQITDALTQGLLGMNFLPALQTIDFQEPLKNIFSLALGHQLTNGDASFMVQMKDLQLFEVSLENSPDFKGVELQMPLAFSIQIKFPALNPYIFHVRTDMKVQLYLEKKVDNRYQLAFGHCRVVPDTIWIQSGNFITPMKNFIVENIERVLGNLIIHNFGAKV
ncbi:BPIB1 protein, partial [Crocuta crocuta]